MPTTLILDKEVVSGGNLKPAPITIQFDPALVAPHIQLAEENYIVPIVCRSMYDDMISKRNSSPSNYNADLGAIVQKFPSDANYETLWTQHLAQLTAWAVILQALPFIGLTIGTNGIFANQIEWGDNVGVKGIQFLEDRIKQNVQSLQGLMQDYLCRNYENYTLFDADKLCISCTVCTDDCGCESKSAVKRDFDGGFIFDDNSQAQPYKKTNNFFL
jgi:hypothetical protein